MNGYEPPIGLVYITQGRILGGFGAAAPGVTKGAPKIRKRKGKEEREKKKEEKKEEKKGRAKKEKR